VIFGFIDPQFIFQTETEIKHLNYNMGTKLDHDKYDELVVITVNKSDLSRNYLKLFPNCVRVTISN